MRATENNHRKDPFPQTCLWAGTHKDPLAAPKIRKLCLDSRTTRTFPISTYLSATSLATTPSATRARAATLENSSRNHRFWPNEWATLSGKQRVPRWAPPRGTAPWTQWREGCKSTAKACRMKLMPSKKRNYSWKQGWRPNNSNQRNRLKFWTRR